MSRITELTLKKIEEQWKKGQTPIIVGGTGLYFKALVDGLVSIPKFKPTEKNKILKLHIKLGQKQFYKRLVKLDPVSKKFINLQ